MKNYLINYRNNPVGFIDDAFDALFRPLFYDEKLDAMKTDIKETPTAYELEVEMPGFEKEDINISVENGYMTISAEKKEKAEDKGESATPKRTPSRRSTTRACCPSPCPRRKRRSRKASAASPSTDGSENKTPQGSRPRRGLFLSGEAYPEGRRKEKRSPVRDDSHREFELARGQIGQYGGELVRLADGDAARENDEGGSVGDISGVPRKGARRVVEGKSVYPRRLGREHGVAARLVGRQEAFRVKRDDDGICRAARLGESGDIHGYPEHTALLGECRRKRPCPVPSGRRSE